MQAFNAFTLMELDCIGYTRKLVEFLAVVLTEAYPRATSLYLHYNFLFTLTLVLTVNKANFTGMTVYHVSNMSYS